MRGASTPFCFRKMAKHSLESVSQDDDLLVVTTQVREEDSMFAAAAACEGDVHVTLGEKPIKQGGVFA